MNKIELSELKRHYGVEDELMSINKICTAYIDKKGEIKHLSVNKSVGMMDDEILEYLIPMNKNILAGRLGKKNIEYNYPLGFYSEKENNFLIDLLNASDNDFELLLTNLIDTIKDKSEIEFPYMILLTVNTYAIPALSEKGRPIGSSGNEFDFMLCGLYPMGKDDSRLVCGDEEGIYRKSGMDIVLKSKNPTDGFMFPIFNDRASDVNSVLYYTSKPKSPSVPFINNVLKCEYTLSSEEESALFKKILNETFDKGISYEKNLKMVNSIKNIIESNTVNSEQLRLSKDDFVKILNNMGESSSGIDSFTNKYNSVIGENVKLTAENLIDEKTNEININKIIVKAKGKSIEKIETSKIDGKNYIMIDVGADEVEVNGIKINKNEI